MLAVPGELPDDGLRVLPKLDETVQLLAFAVVTVTVAEPFCWIEEGFAAIDPEALD